MPARGSSTAGARCHAARCCRDAMNRRNVTAMSTSCQPAITAAVSRSQRAAADAHRRREQRTEHACGQIELRSSVNRRVPRRPRRHAVDAGAGHHAGGTRHERDRAEHAAARQTEPQRGRVHAGDAGEDA